MTLKRINIVAPRHAFGLKRDVRLLADVLSRNGCRVTLNNRRYPAGGVSRHVHRASGFARKIVRNRVLRRPLFDANLLLEKVGPVWLPLARVNCFVPNQEWFHREDVPGLADVDLVMCKTRHAQQIFDALGCTTEFMSFTSMDRRLPGEVERSGGVFHLAGRSHMKGTDALLDVWLRHPEWPPLTVVQSRSVPRHVHAPNVNHVLDYIPDDALRTLQNAQVIHACPSEAEGFGHSIGEGMSCGALVLVTDAPPMNELVNAEHGIPVAYATKRSHHVGTSYQVDPGALEAAIERAVCMGDEERRRLGGRARAWYEQNDAFFRRRLVEVVRAL